MFDLDSGLTPNSSFTGTGRARTLPLDADTHVIHVAGRLGERVSGFLQAAVDAVAQAGLPQTLILVDDPVPPVWASAADAPIALINSPKGKSRLHTWWLAMREVRKVASQHPSATVHLHGMVASLFGARALQWVNFRERVIYSLHGERALAPWSSLAATHLWLMARKAEKPLVRLMSSLYVEDSPPRWLRSQATEFIEMPVPREFFNTARQTEATHPLIAMAPRVGHSGTAQSCAQLAVLMGGSDLRLSFSWLGSASPEDQKLLKAAGIRSSAELSDREQADSLASAWMYVTLDTEHGFADDIAKAMAIGLPCVALDSRSNRDVVEHGLTGYLCRDQAELMTRVAELLDNPSLRARLGTAAAERARRRFSARRFQRAILRAYGFETAPRRPTPPSAAFTASAPLKS